jgi:hypothetical protein
MVAKDCNDCRPRQIHNQRLRMPKPGIYQLLVWPMFLKCKRAMTLISIGLILIGCAPQAPNPKGRDLIAAPAPRPDIAGNQGASGRIIGEGKKNLRAGPATTFAIKNTIQTGESVKVLHRSYDANGYEWVLIRTSKGTEGWIAGHLIEIR